MPNATPTSASRADVEELRLDRAKRRLDVVFADGVRHTLTAEYLRVESPSAEVQGHGPHQKTIVPGKADVTIARLETVGNYAVRIIFDDGHDTGIYSWVYLRELGDAFEARWKTYLGELESRGLTRGPGK